MLKIPIVLASDNNYAKYAAATLVSILENKKEDTFYDFYLLTTSDFKYQKKILKDISKYNNININFIDMKESFNNLKRMIEHISNVTYYRLKMPEILPVEYDKCIYLDTDVTVNIDLSEYFETDLKDNYIAGVKAAAYHIAPDNNISLCRKLNIDNINSYINAGVTIWNLEKIRNDNLISVLYKEAENNYQTVDQDVVNKVFFGKIKILPPKYNVMTADFKYGNKLLKVFSELELKEQMENPLIIHYADRIKPWHNKKIPFSKFWWKYAKKSCFYNEFLSDYLSIQIKNIFNSIFSFKKTKTHRCVKLIGIKLKFKRKSAKKQNELSKIKEKLLYYDMEIIKNSGLFDVEYYINNYHPEIKSKFDALKYYAKVGYKNNENPSFEFDAIAYQKKYNIVENPIVDYVTVGRYRYRTPFYENKYKADENIIDKYWKLKNNSKKVIYTCITNNYDNLEELKAFKYTDFSFDYVCFTDNLEQIKKEKIGIWQIRPLKYCESDNSRNNRFHKINPHLILKEYDESVYLDANINILTSKYFDMINNTDSDILLPCHTDKIDIYEEFEWVKSMNFDNSDIVDKQLEIYKKEGFPKNFGMFENNLIYRKHNNPEIIKMMDEWWYFVKNYSRRDQLSFMYVFWKNGRNPKNFGFENIRIDYKNFCVFEHKKGYETCKS